MKELKNIEERVNNELEYTISEDLKQWCKSEGLDDPKCLKIQQWVGLNGATGSYYAEMYDSSKGKSLNIRFSNHWSSFEEKGIFGSKQLSLRYDEMTEDEMFEKIMVEYNSL